ncbi:MAG: FAD-dependent oxidoreductase [Deltaproteobacteria bacterium]|nr:FAD-dependent oxidoreductase [Deltaproteobacteria bacterium]
MTDNVVIVGGGLVGSALALELARRGVPVLVLEKAVPGAEASSAAAGILAPRVEAHGHAEQRALGLEALRSWDDWVASLEAEVGFTRCGVLVARDESPDPDAVMIEGRALAERAPGIRVERAWWIAGEGMVDTRLLVGAVHAAAVRAGAVFRSGLAVEQVHGGAVSAGGERLVGTPVVCAGAWTSLVPGVASLPVSPVRGQLVAVGATEAVRSVVFGPAGYLVPRRDETVLGATMENVGFARGTTAQGLRDVLDAALRLCPSLGAAPVLRQWSSFRPGSPDGRPIIGEVDGVMVASGHSRNGILLAPLTASRVADAILEGRPLPVAWSPARFSRAG